MVIRLFRPLPTLKLPFNLKIHLALEEVARGVVDLGAGYTITSRRVADDLLLHRVEIDGLKNSEEANHIWLAGLRDEWFGFPDDLDRNPVSR
jgi:hypothetical protein